MCVAGESCSVDERREEMEKKLWSGITMLELENELGWITLKMICIGIHIVETIMVLTLETYKIVGGKFELQSGMLIRFST